MHRRESNVNGTYDKVQIVDVAGFVLGEIL